MIDTIGYIAGFLTLIGFLPQTIKAVRTGKTHDLSLTTFLIIGLSAVMWVTYGFAKHVPALWGTNSVVALCCVTIITLKLRDQEGSSD